MVPGNGFHFVVAQMDRLEEIVQDVADEYAANLRRLAKVGISLPAANVGRD